jgi:pyrroline-5-carboxylate reductase
MSITLPAIAILGTGSMGSAILDGLLQPSVTVEGDIRVTNRTEVKAAALRVRGVTSFATETDPNANLAAIAGARLVLIAVKPQMVADLLREIANALEPDAIVISVAAGIPITRFEELLPESIAVIRAMPNTPAIVGKAVTGLSAGTRSSVDDLALASALFSTVGQVIEVPETKLDAVGSISGSGPAYVFYLIEELTRTAIDLGFSLDDATILVNGTFLGAAELLVSSGKAPSELRRQVTSPRGTTERAIAVLEGANLKELFDRATAAAIARSAEMAAGG